MLEGNTETIGSLTLIGSRNGDWAYGYNETLVDTGGATLSVEGGITSEYHYTNNMPVIKGKLGLPPGNHTIHTFGDEDYALNIQAQIIGDGGFTKTGAKGLIIEGSNSFNEDVIIQQGTLGVGQPSYFAKWAIDATRFLHILSRDWPQTTLCLPGDSKQSFNR